MEDEQAKCSFCGRPQRLVLYLVKGARGRNICDLCVLEAQNKSEPVDTGPWGSHCSFCGRQAEDVKIMLLSDEAGICADCVENSSKTISRVLGEKTEFLEGGHDRDGGQLLVELKDLVDSFVSDFNALLKSFNTQEIDWNAYNSLAQNISPLKSKAGLMSNEELKELLWEIESLFQSIRFDDIETNRPSVEKLSSFVERLAEMVGGIEDS
jgi:hypothetical protein